MPDYGIFQKIFFETAPRDKKTVHITVDDTTINANYYSRDIVAPLWWSVSTDKGEEKYENDLKPFSIPQRYLFAIEWYIAEVNNGGHDQFYFNSTGIVWEDALKGFEAIGASKNVEILKESIARIGGNPSKDHMTRQENLLDIKELDLSDLDKLYYESEGDVMNLLCSYIKANAKDFYFSGKVTMLE